MSAALGKGTVGGLARTVRGRDNRPGQPPGRFWWAANSEEVAQYLHANQSRWLPGRLLHESPNELSDALLAATRQWPVTLHLNQGLKGAAPEAMARDRATPTHHATFGATGLVIVASAQRCAFPGAPWHEPDEPQWQHSLWGANYPRMLEIKRACDPANVFRVHHGVASEAPA